MSLVNWTTPAAWTDCIATATLNGLGSNTGALSAIVVANGTAKKVYADVSIRLAAITTAAGAHMAVYILPLLDDGTTYADGTSGTGTALPTATHYAGALALRVGTTLTNAGLIKGIVLPPGDFKWYFVNRAGIALAGSGNTALFRTYGDDIV